MHLLSLVSNGSSGPASQRMSHRTNQRHLVEVCLFSRLGKAQCGCLSLRLSSFPGCHANNNRQAMDHR